MDKLTGRKGFVYEDDLLGWQSCIIEIVYKNRAIVKTVNTEYTLDRILIKEEYSTMIPNGCVYLEKTKEDL